MENAPPAQENHPPDKTDGKRRRPGENPGLLLAPPAWMKSVIRVYAASAVGLATIVSIAMWSIGTRYGFGEAFAYAIESYGPGPAPHVLYPPPVTFVVALALAIGAYHTIQLRSAVGAHRRDELVLYVSAAHALALLLLCYHCISINRHCYWVFCAMGIRGDSPLIPLLWSFWSSLPGAAIFLLTLPFLGRHIRRYLSRGGWLLQIAAIGIADTVLAVELLTWHYLW